MNRPERDKLAYHIASMMYGSTADHHTTTIGYQLLEDFPCVQEDYVQYKEIFACERVALAVKSWWVRNLQGNACDGPVRHRLMSIDTEIIKDMLDDWSELVDIRLSSFVDRGTNIYTITSSATWAKLLDRYTGDDRLTAQQVSEILAYSN